MRSPGYSRTRRNRKPQVASKATAGLGPEPDGSAIIVLAAAFAALVQSGVTASEVARSYSIIIGLGIVASAICDLKRGLRNLIRADLLCIAALYFLVFTEFLFPQPDFDRMQTPDATREASNLVAIAFAVFAIARHAVKQGVVTDPNFRFRDVSPRLFVGMFLASAFLAYLHMMVAVNFNPVAFFDALVGPRFAVPWARGRLGGWKDLLNEFGLLFNVLPPIAAALWHKRKSISAIERFLVAAILLFTFFVGFCSGTRNVIAGYLAGFLGGFLLTHPRLTIRSIAPISLGAAALFLVASYHMLEFRNKGLRNYISGTYKTGETRETLFVDYNLHAIAELTKTFPQPHPYLGAEVPIWALIKPIPRAIWPGKPEGLSVGIEEAMGESGLTISTTYIGEAYMAYGVAGVVAFSALLAAGAAGWNRVGSDTRSSYSILIFASGLAAFAITMRSMFWFTTAILPAVALVVAHRLWLSNYVVPGRKNRKRSYHIAPPDQPRETGPDHQL